MQSDLALVVPFRTTGPVLFSCISLTNWQGYPNEDQRADADDNRDLHLLTSSTASSQRWTVSDGLPKLSSVPAVGRDRTVQSGTGFGPDTISIRRVAGAEWASGSMLGQLGTFASGGGSCPPSMLLVAAWTAAGLAACLAAGR